MSIGQKLSSHRLSFVDAIGIAVTVAAVDLWRGVANEYWTTDSPTYKVGIVCCGLIVATSAVIYMYWIGLTLYKLLTYGTAWPLQVRVLSPNAQLPRRATSGAAGYDLYAGAADTVGPGQKKFIPTGIALEIPPGHVGKIAARSGLMAKHAVNAFPGTIDSDFRGEIGVGLINHGAEPFKVEIGDRIAQILLERVSTPPVVVMAALSTTARGEGGYGSTGMR